MCLYETIYKGVFGVGGFEFDAKLSKFTMADTILRSKFIFFCIKFDIKMVSGSLTSIVISNFQNSKQRTK